MLNRKYHSRGLPFCYSPIYFNKEKIHVVQFTTICHFLNGNAPNLYAAGYFLSGFHIKQYQEMI